MSKKKKEIEEDIERIVAHLARNHSVKQDVVWGEMYIISMKRITFI